MSDTGYSPAHFFSLCEQEFGFLEQHGFDKITGLSLKRDNREIIMPYYGRIDAQPGIPKILYECEKVIVELAIDRERRRLIALYSYAGDIYCLHGLCFAFKPVYDHGFIHFNGYLPMNETDTVEKTLKYLSAMLYPNMYLMTPWVKAARRKKFEKLVLQREDRSKNIRQHDLEKQRQDALEKAELAFLYRDYKQVISLLKPYESELTENYREKLELSIRKILSH